MTCSIRKIFPVGDIITANMKLDNKAVRFIIGKRKQEMSTYQISKLMKVSERRVNQILEKYYKTGEIPILGKNIGRPKTILSEEQKEFIISEYKQCRSSASILEKIIKLKHNLLINHNKIHQVLLEAKLAKSIGKKVRKKKWIRYERKHSLSAVHLDWMYDHHRGKWILVVLDDASRKILAYGEFQNATVENTIFVLKQAMEYGKIREVITDHGSQFTANKFDKKGNANSLFEEFCKANGIKHILCRIKHPQSNGKVERWFGLYRRHRDAFATLQDFVYWYNQVRPHLSLNFEKLETPEQAFLRKFKK